MVPQLAADESDGEEKEGEYWIRKARLDMYSWAASLQAVMGDE
jgi:hypothetical protein